MVKDHSDSERGNPLPPLHEQQGFFYILLQTAVTYSCICFALRMYLLCIMGTTLLYSGCKFSLKASSPKILSNM